MYPSQAGNEQSISAAMQHIMEQGFSLQLSTSDLGLIAGIELYARTCNAVRLSEGDIHQVFATLDESESMPFETREQRANATIRKLLEQRVLNRLSSGYEGESFYRLSFLGQGIASDLIRQEGVSKKSLETMLQSITRLLDDILANAQRGGNEDFWSKEVEIPLSTTVGLLIEALDQRQRALDSKQILTQSKFEQMYSEDDSIEGVTKCENLINSVADTIKELDNALLQGAGILKTKLALIEEQADRSSIHTARNSARFIFQSLDDMVDWTIARGEKWSEYYQNAHEFLRSAIRLDSRRAFTYRLRQEIGRYHEKPWSLSIVKSDFWRFIAQEEGEQKLERISRPANRSQMETISTDTEFKTLASDIRTSITEKLLKKETITLQEIISPYKHNETMLFQVCILVINELVREGKIKRRGYRSEWIPINESVEIQELTVEPRIQNH